METKKPGPIKMSVVTPQILKPTPLNPSKDQRPSLGNEKPESNRQGEELPNKSSAREVQRKKSDSERIKSGLKSSVKSSVKRESSSKKKSSSRAGSGGLSSSNHLNQSS